MVDGAQGDEGRSVGPDGRYLLQGLLGEGGMASVHRAYDTVLDRTVAVKTMHSELGREQSFRERFKREAQAVAKLNNTNIVAVYDSGEDISGGAPVPYIVMEYVEGKPLRDILNEDVEQFGAMPAEKALKIAADVLTALDASHEHGLVHRDIKPANVMLTRRGVVKVMDFGIARALQSGVTSMTQTGMVVGTPQYLSPEQALGQGVDHRSDLYTTGVMLFEMLTGRLPFEADSPLSIAYHHVQTPPPPASSYNRAIPPAVDALVARSLAKAPNDRFPTAEAMREEILRINRPETLGGNSPLIIAGGPPAAGHVPDSIAQQAFQQYGATPPPATPMPYAAPAGGYPTPTPQPSANPYQQTPPPYAQQPAPVQQHTPPPMAQQHSQGGGGSVGTGGGHGAHGGHGGPKKSNGTLIAIAASVALALIIGVVAIVLNNSDDPKGKQPKAGSSAASQKSTDKKEKEPSEEPSAEDPEKQGPQVPKGGYKTADFKSCDETYPQEDGKFNPPKFSYQTLVWAKECAKRVDLKIKVEKQDTTVWRKGTVLKQDPGETASVSKGSTITLTVSSGKG
jgi:tRNA A-37 threonylcarbamoyl transferase component Bud32